MCLRDEGPFWVWVLVCEFVFLEWARRSNGCFSVDTLKPQFREVGGLMQYRGLNN